MVRVVRIRARGLFEADLAENGGWAAFNSTPRGKTTSRRCATAAEKSQIVRVDGTIDPAVVLLGGDGR